ncbi:MAG: chitobiase/beta-hexosaminidase C-terminal domain-containing protein [Kiritimatiellae bacterium]|nr:chitobiase/beta-hexosaminidase C-terminal domain-containing protein [Kiritimatiellia bacterium]
MRGVFGVACGLVLASILALPARAQECKLDLRPNKTAKIKMAGAPLDTGVVRLTNLQSGAASLPELNVGDVIAFQLFDDVELTIRLTEALQSPFGGSSFLATVDGYDGMMNAVVIQTVEGLQVDIQDFKNSRVYTVFSSESGTTVREINPNAGEIKACEPLVPELSDEYTEGEIEIVNPMSSRLKLATTDQASTVVDILVAYDANAAIWAKTNGGGLDNFALTAVAKMNTALANNGLDSNFRFRLVGTMEVAVSQSDVHEALYAINRGDAGWAAIKAKREEVGADIVTTLIDTGSAYGTTGVGWSLASGTVASFANSAYNVCAIRSVAQSHTMTHEVGHNMGAGHATAVDPDAISPGPQYNNYSAGYYFTANSTKYHTIMAYNYDGFGNSYTAAPLFSSPDCTWEGKAAGDATHDNARTIKETYAEAANWRAQKVALSYDVFFSPEAETLFENSITVTLTPGKAGLPIRYTTDGSIPTLSSKLYSGPFTLTATTTVKAATVNGGVLGRVFEARYLKSDFSAALNTPNLKWTTGSDYPWVPQATYSYDGFAAQSCPEFNGTVGNKLTSWLKTSVIGPAEMSFRYQKKLNSSHFKIYCDGSVIWDDNMPASTVGAPEWERVLVEIPSGTHEVKFAYEQGWGSGGSTFNGIILDTIALNAMSHLPMISPATTVRQSTAMTYTGSMVVTLTPPKGRTGKIFYTLDGSDPTSASAVEYAGPFSITNSVYVQAVFVEPSKEPSVPARGYFLERHPVKAGEWTTDAEGAKTAAAKDGKLIVALYTNVNGCGPSQSNAAIVENEAFLTWAAANGVYLVICDPDRYVDSDTAYSYCYSLSRSCGKSITGTPTYLFALPSTPDVGISETVAFPNGRPKTVQDMASAFTKLWGASSLPSEPTISLIDEFLDSIPTTVTLTNPNDSGSIYYTLDGSIPTKTNGTKYTGAITIKDTNTVLKAAVIDSDGMVGIPLIRFFRLFSDYANEIFGTEGIEWRREGSGAWRYDSSKRGLRTGGKTSETYVSSIIAKISVKGRLEFKYYVYCLRPYNPFTYSVNGVVKDRLMSYCITRTASLDIDGPTTVKLTYEVGEPEYDKSYTGLTVFDVSWVPEIQSTTTTPVAVPHTWIAAKFPSAATSSYETLMNADSDGDGYTNWEEYLCGTDPNGGTTTQTDAVPRCTIRFENGVPVIDHNIVIPSAAQSAGWKATVKGSSDLKTWSTADTAKHKYFKVVVESF